MVLYSSCVAEFRGNLFSLDFVLLIGLCNLNNLLSVYEIPPCGCPVFLCCFCGFLVLFFFNVPPSEGVICNISMNRRGFRLLVLIVLLRSIF